MTSSACFEGPYPADHVVRNINGTLLSYSLTAPQRLFIAENADGNVPLFWGMDSEDNVLLSDDQLVMKKACGKSFAPFPKGCFLTSSGGLRSFERPLKELKPIPWIDSSGQVCGATFEIEEESKKQIRIPRVGSATNWSQC